MEEETLTISKVLYEKLCNDSAFLGCLEACGVDNWNGYGDAQQMMEDEE